MLCTGNLLEQSVKKPTPSGDGGGGVSAVGPAVSGESETAAPHNVSKQEEQMLRVGLLELVPCIYSLHVHNVGTVGFVFHFLLFVGSFKCQILRMSYRESCSIFTYRVKDCLSYKYFKFSYK